MPRVSPQQISFNAGEWSRDMTARSDLAKYGSSLARCENFIPTVQGGLRKRPGTVFVASEDDGGDLFYVPPRLFSYVPDRDASRVLRYGNGGVTIRDSDGAVVSTDGFTTTPDRQAIQTAQDRGNLYFFFDDEYPLVFNGSTLEGWGLDDTRRIDPLLPEEGEITLTASSATGPAVTITASAAVFTEDMESISFAGAVSGQMIGFRCIPEALHDQWIAGRAYTAGSYVWSESYETPGQVNVYKASSNGTSGSRRPGHDSGTESDGLLEWQFVHSEYGYARIVNVVSPTEAAVTIWNFPELPADTLTGVTRWAFGAWSNEFGWPRCGTFFQGRLWLGGTKTQPLTVWASKTGTPWRFDLQTAADEAAIQYELSSDTGGRINWMTSNRRLIIGTSSGTYVASGGQAGITPTAVDIIRDQGYPSAYRQPLTIGTQVAYIQAGQRTLRALSFVDTVDGYVAQDLNRLNTSIGDSQIENISFQLVRDQTLWCYDKDGTLFGMVYEPQEDVTGWHRHTLSGEVISAAVVPAEGGSIDRLFLLVRRIIDGDEKFHLEYLSGYDDDVWVDSAVVRTGSTSTTVTGLSHLEGKEVAVVVDGAVHPNKTVSSGQITLDYAPVDRVVVGLPIVARGETQDAEAGSAIGTAQGKQTRLTKCAMRVNNTGPGLYIGAIDSQMQQVIFRKTADLPGEAVPPFTGVTKAVSFTGSHFDTPKLYFEHRLPQPCTILALYPQLEVSDIK